MYMKRVIVLLIVLFSGALLIGKMLNGGSSVDDVGEEKRPKESEEIKGKLVVENSLTITWTKELRQLVKK